MPTWETAPDCSVVLDAAGLAGFTAIYNNNWFSGRWPVSSSALNIAVKELILIVIAASMWSCMLSIR